MVVNIPFALQQQFPNPFQSSTGSMSWVNLSFFGSLGLACHFPMDYVSQLILTTLTPIGIATLILTVGYIHEKVSK